MVSAAAPYVPLISAAARDVAPHIPAEIWKFFTLAIAHRDEMNLLFPGVRAFMAMGYRADDVEPLWTRCIELGLLRVVQQRGRDEYGRYLPAIYQCNPRLVYIDPTRLESALRVSSIPFCALPGLQPDPDSLLKRGSGLDQAAANLRGKPDPVSSLKSGSGSLLSFKAESGKQNPQEESLQEESEGEPDRQNHAQARKGSVSALQPGMSGQNSQPSPDRGKAKQNNAQAWERVADINTRTAGDTAQTRAEKQNPNPPHPPPSPSGATPSGKGVLKPYLAPLDANRERVAKLFHKVAKDTEIEYARMYCDQYGTEPMMAAIIRYQSIPDEKRAKFRSAAAIMVSWMKEEASRPAAAPQATPADPLEYNIDDADDCAVASVDPALSEQERAAYRAAYANMHKGNQFALPWRPIMLFEDGAARHESEDEMSDRWLAMVEARKAAKLGNLLGGE